MCVWDTHIGDDIKIECISSSSSSSRKCNGFFQCHRNFYSRLTLWHNRALYALNTHFSSDLFICFCCCCCHSYTLHIHSFVARHFCVWPLLVCFIMHKLLPVDITAITHFCLVVFIFFNMLLLPLLISLCFFCLRNVYCYYLHLHFFPSRHVPLFMCDETTFCTVRLLERPFLHLPFVVMMLLLVFFHTSSQIEVQPRFSSHITQRFYTTAHSLIVCFRILFSHFRFQSVLMNEFENMRVSIDSTISIVFFFFVFSF